MQVSLIDSMGTDLSVVNSARVSFSKESDWEKSADVVYRGFGLWEDTPPELSEADQKLIKYLAKNNHWTPFSHVQITMREKVPIFVARQRFKHMIGFSYNEVSRRYVDSPPEFFTPDVWRSRPADGHTKQGSGVDVVEDGLLWVESHESYDSADLHYDDLINLCQRWYENAIAKGVAPEQARMVLPQSMYTEYYCTGSLAAWARAYKLRADAHAQKEIQDLAEQWNTIISGITGLTHSWEALTDGISN